MVKGATTYRKIGKTCDGEEMVLPADSLLSDRHSCSRDGTEVLRQWCCFNETRSEVEEEDYFTEKMEGGRRCLLRLWNPLPTSKTPPAPTALSDSLWDGIERVERTS